MEKRERKGRNSHEASFLVLARFLVATALLVPSASVARAQVSPAEILNPQLKALETKYLPQLKTLNRAIAAAKFPFSFYLSRYVGLDPAQQAEADSRGIEFVNFHDRYVLKITGNYNAAYNAGLLTQNERAARTFKDVIVPILRLVAQEIPSDVGSEAIGFEVSYHARTPNPAYDYEGKEILVVVFDTADAFACAQASEADQQEILNRSEVYLDGSDYGLALAARNPLNVEELGKRGSHPALSESSPAAAASATQRLAAVSPNLLPSDLKPSAPQATNGISSSSGAAPASPAPSATAPDASEPAREAAAAPADAERLQSKYQAQLDALAKDAGKFHFVDYAPPSFTVFRSQIVLQLTLRNSLHFDVDKTSIYKRAAQSFDLFLAPLLKDLLDKVPPGDEYAALDITVVNQLSPSSNSASRAPHPSSSRPSSEAVEFVCPLRLLRQFVDAGITNQQLIDQSIVLVNGVRIALSLQQVE